MGRGDGGVAGRGVRTSRVLACAEGEYEVDVGSRGGGAPRVRKGAAAASHTAAASMGVWKSYVLQEAEAAGRSAKLEWAAREGARVLSLQHDGVVMGKMGRDGGDPEEGEAIGGELAEAVSEAVGYRVRVKVAWCTEARAEIRVD